MAVRDKGGRKTLFLKQRTREPKNSRTSEIRQLKVSNTTVLKVCSVQIREKLSVICTLCETCGPYFHNSF